MIRPRPQALRALLAIVAAASLATCGRETAAPRPSAALAIEATLPAGFDLQAFGLVIDHVRIIAVNSLGDTAFNQVFSFPTNQSSLSLQADVPLAQSPESFQITIQELAGTVLLFSGTQSVSLTSGSNNAPAQVPVTYSGPGQNVATLTLGPLDSVLTQGGTLQFRVTAKDGQGAAVANFYVSWTTSDTTIAKVDATGTLKAPLLRRAVNVLAKTPNGVTTSTSVTFVPSLASVAFDSGCAQSGLPGAQLPKPIVARVLGLDGLGVQGVSVNFSAVTAGGIVATPLAMTDTGGRARTLATLPTTPGPATFQAAVSGLTSAVCSETVASTTLTQLAFTTQPGNIVAGAPFVPPVQVTGQDAQGNTVTSFTGAVTLALGTHPVGTTLGGTIIVNAVAGVATFNNLGLLTVAGGYTLVATALGLQAVVSNSFAVSPGAAKALAFVSQPTTALQGAAITPIVVVGVEDALGNVVTTATNTITMAIGTNPGQATLGGTTSRAAASGLAQFTNLTISAPGTGYALVASATGLTSATSAAFDVLTRPPGVVWTNLQGGNWSNAANWSPARVPGPSDTASIVLPGAYVVTLDVNAHVAFLAVGDTIGGIQFTFVPSRILTIDSVGGTLRGGLTFLQSSDTLAGPGNFTNQGVLSLSNSGVTLASLSNAGSMLVEGNALVSGSFANSLGGGLVVEGSPLGDATLTVSTSFLNAGAIALTNNDPTVPHNATLVVTSGSLTNILGGTFTSITGGSPTGARTLNATLINQGSVVVQQSLTLDQPAAGHLNTGLITLAGGDLTVKLTGFRPAFSNGAGGVIDVGTNKFVVTDTGTFSNQNGGTLQGSGTFDVSAPNISFITNGTTTLGEATPGILHFLGPYLSGPDTNTTIMNVRIGGSPSNPGVDFDQFQISGTGGSANLQGGRLNVTAITTAVGIYPIITLPVGQVFTGDFLSKHLPANCAGAPSANRYLVTCS